MLLDFLVLGREVEQSADNHAFQENLMKQMIALYDEPVEELRMMNLIGDGPDPASVCEWLGVRCIGGIVRAIDWGTRFYYAHNMPCEVHVIILSWIPPHVESIMLYGIESVEEFRTHLLPREMQFFIAEHCKIFGQVRFDALPEPILRLNLFANALTGTVSLHQLPPNIQEIALAKNHLEFLFVDNAKLPESLQKASFLHQRTAFTYSVAGDEAIDPRIHASQSMFGWIGV